MSAEPHPVHLIVHRRRTRGWSQGELARRAGLPRSSLGAIEVGRLTPSVATALAVARALDCSVEELFGVGVPTNSLAPAWAWTPPTDPVRFWEAEVGGRRWLYPAEALPCGLRSHDGVHREGLLRGGRATGPERADFDRTLVLAGCDPAVGLLSEAYAETTGFRLLAFSRGGGAALDLLRDGRVHVAAVHHSTTLRPERNADEVRTRLGADVRLLRCADWEEGVAVHRTDRSRTVRAVTRTATRWALREPGSAARECADELLDLTRITARTDRNHAAVAEAVHAGWAEAGVCVRLCAEEAGMRFLPVRTESLDLCFRGALEHDPRVQALIRLLRSRGFRHLLGDLPGYDARLTGELVSI